MRYASKMAATLVAGAMVVTWAAGGIQKVQSAAAAVRKAVTGQIEATKPEDFLRSEANLALQQQRDGLDGAYAKFDQRQAAFDQKTERVAKQDLRLDDLLKTDVGLRADIALAAESAGGIVSVGGRPRTVAELAASLNTVAEEIARLRASGAGGLAKSELDLQARQLAAASANLDKQKRLLNDLRSKIDQVHSRATDAKAKLDLAQAMAALTNLDLGGTGTILSDTLGTLESRARNYELAAGRITADLASGESKVAPAEVEHYKRLAGPATTATAAPTAGGAPALTRR